MVQALFAVSLQGALMTGFTSFRYADPWILWRELLPEYEGRVGAIARRNGELSLGDYTITEFKRFYAALLAICSAHEFLCYAWGHERQQYPVGSAIIVRSRECWIDLTSELAGMPRTKCGCIIADLTFSFRTSVDLHVNPFVPLGSGDDLAVAPHFPLHSQMEENILRSCSTARPSVYEAMSDEKEEDMRRELSSRLRRPAPQGPIPLPRPMPDIDLLMADEAGATLVVAELKWLRKSLAPKEIPGKDAEVLKGVSQLAKIRRFLLHKPDHLKERGLIPRGIRDYKHVYFLLIARDHWRWIEPAPEAAVVEFDAFLKAMEGNEDLDSNVRRLLTYEWLAIEGRDFVVRHERSTVNGVSIESQIFYAASPKGVVVGQTAPPNG